MFAERLSNLKTRSSLRGCSGHANCYSLITLVLLAVGVITGCKNPKPPIQPQQRAETKESPAPEPGQSIWKVHGHPERVIIFIHGVFGDPVNTWKYSKNTNWPDLLIGDPDPSVKNTDIYMAGYETPYSGNTMTIDDTVSSLWGSLDRDQVFASHREVIIVAHSLGGLVMERLLARYRKAIPLEKIKFIYFYATPHAGADIARIGFLLNADPKLREMIPDNDSFLSQVRSDWHDDPDLFNIKRFCAYEKRGVAGVTSVTESSATQDCTSYTAVLKNHIQIVKPSGRDALSYELLVNKLRTLPNIQEAVPTELAKQPSRRTIGLAALANRCDNPVIGERDINCLEEK